MKPLLCCPAACVWIDSGSIVCVYSFSSDWPDLILAGLSDTTGFTQTGSGSNLALNSMNWNRTRPDMSIIPVGLNSIEVNKPLVVPRTIQNASDSAGCYHDCFEMTRRQKFLILHDTSKALTQTPSNSQRQRPPTPMA
jgi:hypothetical protein